jgi:hypothetical protein
LFLLKTERKQREGALDMQKAIVKHLINIMFVLIAGYFFFTSTQKQEKERGPIVVVDSLLLVLFLRR